MTAQTQKEMTRIVRRLPASAILTAVRQQVARNHGLQRELAAPVQVRGRDVHTAAELAAALALEDRIRKEHASPS